MSISENIKKNRLDLGLTQKELAEKCSLSESSIKYYETGMRNPKKETIEKIAEALNCGYWDLVYPKEERDEFSKEFAKENIAEYINRIAELSNITIEKKYTPQVEVERIEVEDGPPDILYDGGNFDGIEVKYRNKMFNLTAEEYHKLANRIIESIAINILASKEY